VVLLVVAAIVLWLTANTWKKVAPTAIDVTVDRPSAAGSPSRPEGVATPGPMPNLKQTRVETDRHAEQVQEALKATE